MTDSSSHAVLHFTLATAGHVDHGKTSLLRALTGIDPDRLKEEKEREMTTDIGFAHLRFSLNQLKERAPKFVDLYQSFLQGDKVRHDGAENEEIRPDSELVVGFVDVPGHGKFLKNMLAGVGGIDMALLVIALDEGVMPQTVQHVKILSLLGVRNAILVLTKADLAHESEVEAAKEEAADLLLQYDINVVSTQPVSNLSGEGVEELKDAIVESVLLSRFSDNRFDLTGKPMPCFLPVDRIFSKAGHGVVVTGTLISGEIAVGDSIKIAPAGLDGRVRGLETFNHKIEKAYPGQRLAVNIATKEARALERGQCVVSGSGRKVSNLIVQISDLGGLEARNERKFRKLKPQPIRFYHGTAERTGSLRWLTTIEVGGEVPAVAADVGAAGVDALAADVGAAGVDASAAANDGDLVAKNFAIGQIHLREPILAYPGQNFVLRYGDYGIAGGVILMTERPRWLNRESVLEISKDLLSGKKSAAVLDFIMQKPGCALRQKELLAVVGQRELEFELGELIGSGKVLRLNELLIASESLDEIEAQIKSYLKEKSAEKGVPTETLRVDVAPLMERIVFQHLINHLVESGGLVKREDRLSLPEQTQSSSLPKDLSEKEGAVLNHLSQCVLLELSELAGLVGLSESNLEKLIESLEKDKRVYLVNYKFVASAQSLENAHRVLAQIWNQKRTISPSDFRQEVGTSRKYAMALLAHFDDSKVTRRLPSGRVLLKAP